MPEFPPQFWLAGIIAYTAVVGWLWRVAGTAKTAVDGVEEIKKVRAEDKKVNDARLDKAEANHIAIIQLPGAVDRFTDRFTLKMEQLAERHEEAQARTQTQLGEVKDELGHVRNNAKAAQDAARELASRMARRVGE